jgi:hypothetical protein
MPHGDSVPELAGIGLGKLDPLYTATEVARYLRLDTTTTRRLFLERADVVRIGRAVGRGAKRSYVNLRIPRSTLERFIRERTSRRPDGRRRAAAQPGGGQGAAE